MSEVIVTIGEEGTPPVVIITPGETVLPTARVQVQTQEETPVVHIHVDENSAQSAADSAAAAQAVLDALLAANISNKLDKGGYVGTAQTLANTDVANLAAAQSYAANLITQLIDGAPVDANTLKELNDKIIALQAIVGSTAPDGDSIVNTVTELLAVFADFPEGVDISTLFASKVDKTDVYNVLDCVVSGKVLDARQGKVLNDLITALTTTVNGKEDISNKSNDIEADKASVTKYGNIAAWVFWLLNKFFPNITTKATPTLADNVMLGDSVDSNKTKKSTLQNIRDLFQTFFDLIYATKSTDYSKIVYVNTATPTTATIFDINNPPITNDNLLKSDDNNLYIASDSSTWVYKTSTGLYGTKVVANLFPIEVTGNQTVQESWNNKDVYVMGSGTLTYPNTGLSAGHNFNLCADAGVTIAWAIASPKTWRVAGLPVGTAPPSVIAGQFCMISARIGSNEIRVLGL
jgi:hypothetical protein